jgi:chemotaxis protein CheZ
MADTGNDEEEELDSVKVARELAELLNKGDVAAIEQLLDTVAQRRQKGVLSELGRLTRQLHEALNSVRLDPRLASMVREDLPDVKNRLDYIVKMSEQAANKTLAMVEAAIPLLESIRDEARAVQPHVAEPQAKTFCAHAQENCEKTLGYLTEVLTAQAFQDLTGQVVSRLIALVQNMETHLLQLLLYTATTNMTATEGETGQDGPYSGPLVSGQELVREHNDVDALLSQLGF